MKTATVSVEMRVRRRWLLTVARFVKHIHQPTAIRIARLTSVQYRAGKGRWESIDMKEALPLR